MGYYINPPDMTKEQFLSKYGTPVDRAQVLSHTEIGTLPVCWVCNGMFTAAGIAYSKREVEEFARLNDPRPKQWFLVSRADLKPYYDGS